MTDPNLRLRNMRDLSIQAKDPWGTVSAPVAPSKVKQALCTHRHHAALTKTRTPQCANLKK